VTNGIYSWSSVTQVLTVNQVVVVTVKTFTVMIFSLVQS